MGEAMNALRTSSSLSGTMPMWLVGGSNAPSTFGTALTELVGGVATELRGPLPERSRWGGGDERPQDIALVVRNDGGEGSGLTDRGVYRPSAVRKW